MNEKTRWLMDYVLDTYGVEPEYPWVSSPGNSIFRNARTKKWFAVLMGELPVKCLGLTGKRTADVLNLKCDPIMAFSLIDQKRIFRAYHMNKEHWISVLLDSDITSDELAFLVDMSYRLVDQAGKRKKTAYAAKGESDGDQTGQL